MRDTSRRSLLAAFSAVPAATLAAALPLPVLARPAAPVAVSAEVPELTRLFEAAQRRTTAANEACDAAWERFVRPVFPEALFQQPSDPLLGYFTAQRHGDRSWYGSSHSIDMLRGWNLDHLAAAGWTKQIARRAEVLAAYDQWEADNKAAEDAAGITAANIEYHAAWDQETPVRHRILALRSADPSALRLKVRVYVASIAALDWRADADAKISAAVETEGGPWEDAFAASILRDIATAYAPADA